MRRSASVCAVLAALIWLAACGGNVVVDSTQGSGGLGGSGGSGGSQPDGVGGSQQQSLCEQLCSALASQNCGGDQGCIESCQGTFEATQAQCLDELATYFQCFTAALASTGCNPSNVCLDETLAYASCGNPGTGGSGGSGGIGGGSGCGEIGCDGGSDECSCKGFCYGQDRAVVCSQQSAGYVCDCYLDGKSVGTCSDSANLCDIEFGCCSAYFGGGI